jgi:dGTP triphosphohydrolase
LYKILDNEFGATPVQAYQGYAFRDSQNGTFTILDTENFNQAVSDFNNQSGNLMNDVVPVIIQQYNVSNIDSKGNRIIESISNDFISACTINEYNEAMAVDLTKNYSEAQGVVNKIVVDEKKQNIIGSDSEDGGMTGSMNSLTKD